jgi:hypothetical protein
MQVTVEYRRRPSALAYMARAFHRSRPFEVAAGFPAVRVLWRDVRVDRGELAAFTALTGLRAQRWVPLLYPHVTGFRLLMSLLTHPAWPLPIWRALQVRNHLVQHRPIEIQGTFGLQTSVGEQRVLERGLEVDLCTQARVGDDVAWESIVTFYYRGRFGAPGMPSPLAQAPEPGEEEVARWHTQRGPGCRSGASPGTTTVSTCGRRMRDSSVFRARSTTRSWCWGSAWRGCPTPGRSGRSGSMHG